ncbi:MAG: hypothetical protein JSR31_05945 [Nitrospira sp.]|nr:hypothetical protein [Nitrospira sp.]
MDTERACCTVTLLPDPLQPERDRQALPCAVGQWLSEVAADRCAVGEWVAVDGGRVLPRDEWDQHLLVPGSEILLYPRVTDSTVVKVVTGIVFAPLGVYWALRAAGMPSWASGLVAGSPIGMSLFQSIENIVSGKPSPANVPRAGSALESSPTYGFSGIQNTTRIGAPIPVVYGRHRVGGQIINSFVETRDDNDVLHMLLALSEGEVLSISEVEINGQPLSNYTGVSYDARAGTNSQSAIGLFGDKSATTYSAEGQLTTATITYTTQADNITGFIVHFLFPGGLFSLNTSGVLGQAGVTIQLDYKLHSSGTWTTGITRTIVDSKRAALRREIRIDGEVPGQYDIRVSRTTTESTSTTKVDAVLRSAVTELVNDGYTYPNTAVMSLEALATNQLSGGIPRVTALVYGVKVRQFTALLTYAVGWTQSPAWIAFDILTNPRYGHGQFTWRVLQNGTGLNVTNGSTAFTNTGTAWTAATLRRGDVLHDPVGQAVGIVKTINYGAQSGTFQQAWGGPSATNRAYEVRSNDLDIPSFVQWDAFCQTMVPNGNGAMEPRARCNLVLDAEQEDVWSVVMRVCGVGQASAIKIGTYIRIKVETVATPVQLFTMANIKPESFEEVFLSLKDRSNIFEVQFLDETNSYQQDVVVLEDPLIFTNSEQPRRKTIEVYGITRRSQAQRVARFNQRVNRLMTRTITFEVGLDAVACEPGDVIRFQHDIPQWGFGGRAAAGSSSTTIVLDRAVTIVAGKSYEVLIRYQNDVVDTRTVATGPGTVTTLTIAGFFSQTPAQGDVWAFGETRISTKPFRMITVERTQDLDVRITAVEYSDAVYDETGLTIPNPVQYSSLGDLLGPPGQVKHLTMLAQDGAIQNVWVSWAPPGSGNFHHANVYRIDSGKVLLGSSTNGSFAISSVKSGTLVTVKVTAVSGVGVESDYVSAPTASLVAIDQNPPDVPTLVLEGDRLRWNYPNPPIDLAGFLVRFRPGTSSNWATATPAHDNLVLTTDLQIFRRSGVQTFLVKAVDQMGNESVNAKPLTVDFGLREVDNIIHNTNHRTQGWPGTVTNASVISGDLRATASALMWTMDSAGMWGSNPAALMWTAAYTQMRYELEVIPTDDEADGTLKLPMTMAGEWSIEYQSESSRLMWQTDSSRPMWGVDASLMWDALGDYTQWPGLLDHLRQQRYAVRITGHAGVVQAILQELSVVIDVPDKITTLEDVVIASGGTRLTVPGTPRKIVSVRVAIEDDGGSAAYAKVMDKDAVLGPLIKVFTSSDAATSGMVDAVIHWY